MKSKYSFADWYLEYALIGDIILALIVFASSFIDFFAFKLIDKTNQINTLLNLANSDIAMSGFILASLTVIVTYKSNYEQSKERDSKKNPLIILFVNGNYYRKMIGVFHGALIELILSFFLAYCFIMSSDNIDIIWLNKLNVIILLITFLPIIRCIWLLLTIIKLSSLEKN